MNIKCVLKGSKILYEAKGKYIDAYILVKMESIFQRKCRTFQ